MARRLVLHVGLMKSGTSFLQQVMKTNRAALRERGVLFPGPWRTQVQAVRDIIAHGGSEQPPLAGDGAWHTVMRQVDQWPGTAVVSMEFLGPRRLPKVRDIVRHLPECDVQVVISARDLARSIPAMWQENVQNGGARSWEEYLEGVRVEDRTQSGPGRGFWSRQDVPEIVGTWLRAAGAEHVTLLTVPPRGAPPALLWERFASVVGVDPGGLDLEVLANPSLGLASLEVLRALNLRLRDGVDEPVSKGEYERTVKQLLSKRGLARRTGEPRLGYHADWVVERADADVARLRESGVRVVGDLEDLRASAVPGTAPDELSSEVRLEAALDALALVTEKLAHKRGTGNKDD